MIQSTQRQRTQRLNGKVFYTSSKEFNNIEMIFTTRLGFFYPSNIRQIGSFNRCPSTKQLVGQIINKMKVGCEFWYRKPRCSFVVFFVSGFESKHEHVSIEEGLIHRSRTYLNICLVNCCSLLKKLSSKCFNYIHKIREWNRLPISF